MLFILCSIIQIVRFVRIVERFCIFHIPSTLYAPDWFVSIIVGLLTGIISSYAVSRHYWRKAIKRDARAYLKSLNAYLRELNRVLLAFHFTYNQSDKKNTNYDEHIGKIQQVYDAKPDFDKLYLILPEVRFVYPKFDNCSKRLSKLLSSYESRKHVLSILNNENVDYTSEELELRINQAIAQQRNAVLNLSYIHVSFFELQNEINEKGI